MPYRYLFPEDSYLLLGVVVRAQGLRGEICVHTLSGEPESFGKYAAFTLVDKQGTLSPELRVKSFRVQKGKVILRLERIDDRTFAEKVVGMGVLIARSALPEPAANEFYWHELYDRPVRTVRGRQLGTIRHVFFNGAQDVMVIGDGEIEYLIPVHQGMIVEQHPTEIVIDPPPGLLDINAENEEANDAA